MKKKRFIEAQIIAVLMTMETWWLGFYLPRERIGLFILGQITLLSVPCAFGAILAGR